MTAVRPRRLRACVVLVALSLVTAESSTAAGTSIEISPGTVQPNDNRKPAGTLEGGTLKIALRAAPGRWQPEGPAGPTLEIEAFGEVGRPLTVPAPLLRVPEGTEIAATIRNDLATPLVVHGLCTRAGKECATIDLAPGSTREVRFASGPAGTYHYWASTFGAPVPFRELAGAFVVDASTRAPEPDRILVITEWTSLTLPQLRTIMLADDPGETFVGFKPKVTFVINVLSWPVTERFDYQVGEPVRWRVINLSSQTHPLHLHGFYFDVESLGNGLRDSSYDEQHRRRVVTQVLPSGGTLGLRWTPERAGNWLFHCHVMHHVSLDRRLGGDQHGAAQPESGHGEHHGDAADPSLGMAGMVIGVHVRERATATNAATAPKVARKLTLEMTELPGGKREPPVAGFVLREPAAGSVEGTAVSPGPPIVLRRDEPVEITLVNRLREATAIHWHGMELESFYDGVHGFSGSGRQVTPMIEPGDTFVVRFTPPRAGTFIYHTHLHDYRQLSSGLYGPLIVTGSGESFDPESDHVLVLGRSGLVSEEPSILAEPESAVLNGERSPRLVWKAGVRHRVRLINITPDDIFSVSLLGSDGPVQWTPVAKDGAAVPAAEAVSGPARQAIAVGETYDFTFDAPPGRRNLWIEVRTPAGKWQVQGHVVVK